MKDIISNRSRISLPTKLRLLRLSLQENGLIWSTLMGAYYAASAVGETAFSAADRRRHKHALPGMNSSVMNKVIWENWDWSARGEEWTPSADWKESVITTLLRPNVREGDVVVEIGPGGGRWTVELQKRARKLTGIDISEACIRQCQALFAGSDNVEFILGNGSDLAPVPSTSVDAIWSFDVFVHINRPQFRSYAGEFARVLRPGGRGVIQHGSVGGAAGGWRSDATTEDVHAFLTEAGLEVVDQLSTWHDAGKDYKAGLYGDVATIFRKPTS